MPSRFLTVAAFAAGLLFLAGCGPAKLNVSRSYDVGPGEANAVDLDAQPKPQKLTVEFKATEEVTVLVFKAADAKGEDAILTVDAAKSLAQQKGKSGTVTADVPENTATRVVVRGAAKTSKVDLTITNK